MPQRQSVAPMHHREQPVRTCRITCHGPPLDRGYVGTNDTEGVLQRRLDHAQLGPDTGLGECRACGFCNQTNPTLPYNSIATVYRGKPVRMCYYFKQLRTRELSREMLEGAKALYAWVEEHYEVAA
jgi:hypothetical protein